MASIVVSGDTSGAITLSAPSVAGTNTITLPAATGTAMVSGNMPAFRAYGTSFQSVSNSTWTKVSYNTTTFDTASAYDNVTNYRFNPKVAGYYQVNWNIGCGASITGYVATQLYKNGSGDTLGAYVPNSNQGPTSIGSSLVYLNGSTDYVEIYMFQNSGGSLNMGSNASVEIFSGVLIRAA